MNELDHNKLFPNQLVNGELTECEAISASDVLGNMLGFPCDPDYTYAAAFKVSGREPSTAGAYPVDVIDGAIAFGVLPAADETFTALSNGELWVANYSNYPPEQVAIARGYAQNGKLQFYTFDEVYNFVASKKRGVILSFKWYQTFNITDPDGFIFPPGGVSGYHAVACYDVGPTTNERSIAIKPWLGADYGKGGYSYMTESIFNQVFQFGYTFDPSATRWLSLLTIAARRFPYLLPYLPQIIAHELSSNSTGH